MLRCGPSRGSPKRRMYPRFRTIQATLVTHLDNDLSHIATIAQRSEATAARQVIIVERGTGDVAAQWRYTNHAQKLVFATCQKYGASELEAVARGVSLAVTFGANIVGVFSVADTPSEAVVRGACLALARGGCASGWGDELSRLPDGGRALFVRADALPERFKSESMDHWASRLRASLHGARWRGNVVWQNTAQPPYTEPRKRAGRCPQAGIEKPRSGYVPHVWTCRRPCAVLSPKIPL